MPYPINKAPLNAGDITYEIKDGILFVERHAREEYTFEKLKINVGRRLKYTEGFSYPMILFGKDMLSIDKMGRDYMATEGAKNALSRAFVVEKAQGKLALNFFIERYKQIVPAKVFENMDEAIEWSKQLRKTMNDKL
jgi:hypothetical protein